jgi:hypothetical protein
MLGIILKSLTKLFDIFISEQFNIQNNLIYLHFTIIYERKNNK